MEEIQGYISYVNKKNKKIFRIRTSNNEYRAIYDKPLDICVGDAIHGFVTCKNNDIMFLQHPLILIPSDRISLTRILTKALRGTGFSSIKSVAMIDNIVDNVSCEQFCKEMDKMACNWHQYNNADIFLGKTSILRLGQYIVLCKYWYTHCCLRRLALLDITEKEIKDCQELGYTLSDIYNLIIQNVYILAPLSIDKCTILINMLGKHNLVPRDKISGLVVRKVWSCLKSKGWTFVPVNVLIGMMPEFEFCKDKLDNFNIKIVNDCVYFDYVYKIETYIVNHVVNLVFSPCINTVWLPDDNFWPASFTKEQKESVIMACTQNISIILGAAGTGKTTVIKCLCDVLTKQKRKYKVVAFTGKAVARLYQVMEKEDISTMNRLMANPKKFTHLIIDEASMVTSLLFYQFLHKFKHYKFSITFVGDHHQLSPIGWGHLFDQLLVSKLVPVTKLEIIHRTLNYKENGILLNAKNIITHQENSSIALELTITENFKFYSGDVGMVETLILNLKENSIKSKDIVIITPFNKELYNLNAVCQKIYNSNECGEEWKDNDRVMMKFNNYEVGVMNGEEGIVVNKEDKIVVDFGYSRIVNFGVNDLDISSIMLAFAISVHKSQGSEWPYVIIYFPDTDKSEFCNYQLIYTAITRASVAVWCVGDKEKFREAASAPKKFVYDNLGKELNLFTRIN